VMGHDDMAKVEIKPPVVKKEEDPDNPDNK
jgi:hypothetical protein